MRDGAASNVQAISWALQTTFAAIILVLFSLLHINFGGPGRAWSLSFALVPIAIIYLWPFQSHRILSVWAVLFIGLFHDFLSGGPLGVWAIIYTIMFLILDPVNTRRRYTLGNHMLIFSLVCCSSAVMSFCLGRIALGQWPVVSLLAQQTVVTILVFPIIYKLSRWASILLSGDRREDYS